MFRFLLVDDDETLRFTIRTILESKSYEVDEAEDGRVALQKLEDNHFNYDGVFLDVNMPNMGGLETLSYIKRKSPNMICVLLTAYLNVDDAKEAMQKGAYDYLEKPITPKKLFRIIDEALATRSMVKDAGLSAPQMQLEFGSASMVGETECMKKVFELIYKLSQVDTSVLITGESGTGKELVARALHYSSYRKKLPFVVVNCGAIPEGLIESELFGHEKGAFTGADRKKIGKFQYANGGTLFLDEIGDMPQLAQVKLLRVLQESKFSPVGSNEVISSDVRIIAATNKNLGQMVKDNTFRADLFYRLNVFPITLPPLRERVKDIKTLVSYMISKLNKEASKHVKSTNYTENSDLNNLIKITGIDFLALKALENYSWPGNIRELENVVEHAFVLEKSSTISFRSLPDYIKDAFKDSNSSHSSSNLSSDIKTGMDKINQDPIYQDDINTNTDLDQADNRHLSFMTVSENHESQESQISPSSQPISSKTVTDDSKDLDFVSLKEEFEKNFLIKALKKYSGKINKISLSTNITKMTLLRKLEKYGLNPKDYYVSKK